ncbi:MAG: hypothetical protein ACOCQM_02305 [Natronomonas sp.]
MKPHPSTPAIGDAPGALLDGGHLWIQELLDGAPFRFRLRSSGVVEVGDGQRRFGDGEVPIPYEHAVRHVRANLDREALRRAVDDVASVTFLGVAMHHQTVDYDWYRTPSVLGVDVFDADRDRYLTPDAVEGVYERLGLESINNFEKEVRALDFDPETVSIPGSAYYDGPAAGLLIRDKTGNRASVSNPDVELDVEPEQLSVSAEEAAERYATDRRFDRVATTLRAEGRTVTVDALFERTVESILRAVHDRLLHPESTVEMGAFRSAVAARVRAWLSE